MIKNEEVPSINLEDLVKSYDGIDLTILESKDILNQNDLELLFEEKIRYAKKNFDNKCFNKFWEEFLFLTFGEIELKSQINKYIEAEKPTDKIALQKIDSYLIGLLGFFVSYRHALVDFLYENIVLQIQLARSEEMKNNLLYDVQKFIIICISALKIIVSSLNKNSLWLSHRIHRLVIDDIEYSLYSALNLGNIEFNLKKE